MYYNNRTADGKPADMYCGPYVLGCYYLFRTASRILTAKIEEAHMHELVISSNSYVEDRVRKLMGDTMDGLKLQSFRGRTILGRSSIEEAIYIDECN